MMTTYIALLRGINVGGNNKVAMSDLRRIFESLGHTNVSTYINSGNIMFSSEKARTRLVREIERAITKELGLSIRVLLLSASELSAIVKRIPSRWKNDKTERTDVLFLWEEYDKKTTLALIPKTPNVDDVLYVRGAIIWHVDRRLLRKSGMKRFIGTVVYKHMTARNVNTVRKLHALTVT